MEENRNNSLRNRDKIRKYGEVRFGWNNLIKNYLNIITNNI